MATIDITEALFPETIENNDIVFVDFWADWCGPCKNFAPVYKQVSEQHDDVVFAKVDTEAEQGLAAAANITSIPTLMAFRERVLVFSQPGALNAQQFGELVDAVKGLDMTEVHAQIAAQQNAQPAGPQA
jgi:thioredoxin 1